MKTRFYSHVLALSLLIAAGALGLKSCAPELVDPPITTTSFGAIRILNFAECDQLDVYIFREGSLDTSIVRGINYGISSVYTNNLLPGTYKILLTDVNRKGVELASATSTVEAGKQLTFVIRSNGDQYVLERTPDFGDRSTLDPKKVYLRFIHANSDLTKDKTINVKLNNPLERPLFNPSDIQPGQVTDYVTINHTLDSSYTIYLTESNSSQIIARLAGAAFSPGQTYTITYAGNPGHCRDTTAASGDFPRIRYFDDNELGNEQTFPVPQSLMFNFINALIPSDALDTSIVKPVRNLRRWTKLGLVVNNDDRFTFSDVPVFGVAPTVNMVDSIHQAVFRSIPWTEAVQVSAYIQDGLPSNQRGTKIVDLRLGNRRGILSDRPFSILLFDTIRVDSIHKPARMDSASNFIGNWAIPIPDQPEEGSARIVLVNALGNARGKANTDWATMYIDDVKGKLFNISKQSPFVDTTNAVPSNKAVNIKATVGRTSVTTTVVSTFVPVSGGIYIVVLVGAENHSKYPPQFIIVHTNPVLGL